MSTWLIATEKNLQMCRAASFCRSLPHSERKHWHVEPDHVDTKIEKTESLYIFRRRSNGTRSIFLWTCTGPPICLFLWGSTARTPAVFRVHCWADEGATTEGRRQLEVLGWEVKQRLGGCWMAGWTGPLVVHFQGPKGTQKDEFVATFLLESPMVICLYCNVHTDNTLSFNWSSFFNVVQDQKQS